jgi:hypothetical protein
MKALRYLVVRRVRGEDLLAREALADQKEIPSDGALACHGGEKSSPRHAKVRT